MYDKTRKLVRWAHKEDLKVAEYQRPMKISYKIVQDVRQRALKRGYTPIHEFRVKAVDVDRTESRFSSAELVCGTSCYFPVYRIS
jgi:hypothetical protein